MLSMQLRVIEHSKIEFACKFFEQLNHKISNEQVKYDVVDNFGKLMALVK